MCSPPRKLVMSHLSSGFPYQISAYGQYLRPVFVLQQCLRKSKFSMTFSGSCPTNALITMELHGAASEHVPIGGVPAWQSVVAWSTWHTIRSISSAELWPRISSTSYNETSPILSAGRRLTPSAMPTGCPAARRNPETILMMRRRSEPS